MRLLLTSAFLAASPLLLLADELNGHTIRLDATGKLISWVEPQSNAYSEVVRRAWNFLLHVVPVESNGLKTFYSNCCLDLKTMRGRAWPHDPASVNAGLAESAVVWFAFSGDSEVVKLVKDLLDYQLAHGTTPVTWTWASVPYASSNPGDTEYRGAFDFQYGGAEQRAIGDGYGVTEPDKAGELGIAYLKFFELTGEARYRDAAIACANALARNVREGAWNQSPWPFRVYAETGRAREEYSSNVIGPVRLLDELIRLGLGDTAAYRKARGMAWQWMMEFPMRDQLWSGYFEDVFLHRYPNNLNQYSPMETARYLMEHPEFDERWSEHVPQLIDFVERHFVIDVPREPAVQWGANAVSEQVADMNKMGSHTSRYAAVNAMWYESARDAAAKEKAYRSFNWATYMCRDNGFVHVGPVDQSLWFSDGYADYIRHFMAGMAAAPEWAPERANHVLRSTSVVRKVKYGERRVEYETFDKSATEVVKLSFKPVSVMAGGTALTLRNIPDGDSYTVETLGGDFVVRVRHAASGEVRIAGD